MLYCFFKFVYYRSNNSIGIALQKFNQAVSGCCILNISSAFAERTRNLVIEIYTICYKNYFRIVNIFFKRDCLCKHNHCKRFAASLCVPRTPMAQICRHPLRDEPAP